MASVSVDEIVKRLKTIVGVHRVDAEGDGYHYQLIVVAEQFEGLSRLKREQWVYAQLMDFITTGQLHALTMKTWTISEWEKNHG